MKNLFSKKTPKLLCFIVLLNFLFSTGKAQSGAALDFDGSATSDFVNLSNSITELAFADFTIEAWIKTTGSREGIVTCMDGNGVWEPGEKCFYIDSLGIPKFVGNSNSYIRGNIAVNDGAWHHVAVVWTYTGGTSGVGHIYVDAIDRTGVVTYITNYGNYGNFWIGTANYWWSEAPNYFTGKIDEVRIWSVARTQCQIEKFKDCEISTTATGLQANYHFNQGTAGGSNSSITSLSDASGNANNGILYNFGLSGSTSNWVSPGGVVSGYTTAAVVSLTVTASSSTICNGESTTLNVSGANTYNWGFGSGSSVIVSPTTNTTYTVIGTSVGGCTNSATKAITVKASPTVTITPSSTLICSGTQVTLTAGGATSYLWSNASTNTVITFSPNSNATRTVTGTAANGCTDVAVQTISVNTTPTVSISPSSTVICSANTVTLIASGATTYTWSNGLGNSATVTLGPNSTFTRTVTGETNGCTDVAAQTISVNPSPTISISATSTLLCSGETQTLTASGGNTYTWTGGPTTAAYAVTPAATLIYTVTGKTTASGCTDIATQSMSVITSPTVTIAPSSTVICSTNVVTLTAGGAITYTWSNALGNSATVTLGPNSNFTRTVIGTAANGCTDQAVQTISVNPTPTVAISGTTVICSGKATTLTAAGASSYVWTGGPSTAAYALSPTVTTNYTVIGTTSGCTDVAVQSVSVNASPVLTITPGSTVICSGKTTTITGSGASTYTWTGGPSTAGYAVTPSVTTIYTLTGTAANSCTDNAVQSISVNASPTLAIAPSSTVICSGKTATLTGSGASTYTWTGGPSTASYAVSPTITTIYTLTGTAANSCTDNAVQSISVNTSPVLTVTPSSTVLCSGNSATLIGTGASSYTWTGGPSTGSYVVTPSVTTIYTLTGTAANSCTDNAVQSISVNITPTVAIAPSSTVICSGKVATLTASGAASYAWTSGPSTAVYTVSPSANIIYTVTGTTSGCTNTAVQSMSVNTTPVLTITPSSTVICSGNSATLTASGAGSYVWTSGPSTAGYTVSPVANTSYTVTGTTSGCTNTAVQSVSVNATPVLTITPSSTLICSGNVATLTAGGAGSYVWTSGPSTAVYTVNPLSTLIYTVIGTTSGCTNTAAQSISVNATPVLTITPSSTVICSGKVATLTASGAGSYAWTSGPSTAGYTVSPGANIIYTVTGTTSGCTNTAVQSISVNATPVLTITPSSTLICSGNVATLTAGGAVSYVWTSGPSTAGYTINPSATTIYTVTGTTSGCTNTAVQSISVNTTPVLTITPSSTVICSGKVATLTAGGAGSYAWTSGPSTAIYTVNPLANISYTVTGTTSGCTNTAVQSISVNATPALTITPTSTLICSGNAATLTASGAGSYVWASGPSTAGYTINPSATTIYTVTGTTSGCTNTAVQSISVNATPVLTITPSSTLICSGKTITMTASGATSYVWASGPSTAIYTVTPPANIIYTVTGTSSGCTNTAVQNVSVNASPALTIATTGTLICTTGTTTLTASGASTYSWTGGPSTASYAVSPLTNTSYTLTGTNSISNCTSTAVQNISVVATVVLTITPSSTVICSGKTATLSAIGASSYTWVGGPNTGTYAVSPASATVYTVTGTAGTCSNTTTQSIAVNALPSLTITPSATVMCSGSTVTLTATGANTYTWTGGPSTASYSASPSITTIFTVTGTAANNCSSTAVKSISVNASPVLTITPSSTVMCAGSTTTLTASGASTYSWTNGPSAAIYTINPTANTNYTVTGTASNNCTSTAVKSISVNSLPVVTIASSNSVICEGSTTTLTAAGAINYTWTAGPFTASNVVSPTVSTIYTVTGEASNCISTAVSSITVNAKPVITVNSGTICTGNSFTIAAGGASTYSWSTGANTSSINVTPLTNTVYVVTGTNTNNCTGTASSSVVVANILVVTIAPSSTAICAGNSATLTANGANTFSWSNASTSASIVVSPSLATTYSVAGYSGPTCSNTASQLITINPSPTISVSGNTFICLGLTTSLNASGAATYTWSNGANGSTISVTPTITSTYTVSGSNAFNCINSRTFQVHTTPVITPSICLITVDSLSNNNEIYWNKIDYPQADTFIVLRENSASVYTPIARIPKTAFSSYADTNRSIGPITGNPNLSSHKYKLQFRDSCGNLSPMSDYHQSIFVQDNQTGNFTWNLYYIQNFGTVQTVNYILWRQSVTTGVSTTVAVTSGNAATDPQYASLAAAGNVKWFVSTSGFNCSPSLRESGTSDVTANKTKTKSNSTNERQYPVATDVKNNIITAKNIHIYPNPVQHKLKIETAGPIAALQLVITDLTGWQIYTEVIATNKCEINTESMNNGVYFISLYDKDKLVCTRKIIVQH